MTQWSSFKDVRRGDSFYDAISVLDSPDTSSCMSFDQSTSSSSVLLRNKAATRLSSLVGPGPDDRPMTSGTASGGGGAGGGVRSRLLSGRPPARTCATPPCARDGEPSAGTATEPSRGRARSRRQSLHASDATAQPISATDTWSLLFPSQLAAEQYLARNHLPISMLMTASEAASDEAHDGLARVQSRGDLHSFTSSQHHHLPHPPNPHHHLHHHLHCHPHQAAPQLAKVVEEPAAVSAEDVWSPLGPLPHAIALDSVSSGGESWATRDVCSGVPWAAIGSATSATTTASKDGSTADAAAAMATCSLTSGGGGFRRAGQPWPGVRKLSSTNALESITGAGESRVSGSAGKRTRAVRLPESASPCAPRHHSSLPSEAATQGNGFRSVLPGLMLPGFDAGARSSAVTRVTAAPRRTSPSILQRRSRPTSASVAAEYELQPLSSSRLNAPSMRSWSPVWSSPISHSSSSSVGTGGVVFLGEYSLRNILGTSFPSLASGDGANKRGPTVRCNSRGRRTGFPLSSPSLSDGIDSKPSLKSESQASQRRRRSLNRHLFRVMSDGTLTEESAATCQLADDENDADDEEEEGASRCGGRRAASSVDRFSADDVFVDVCHNEEAYEDGVKLGTGSTAAAAPSRASRSRGAAATGGSSIATRVRSRRSSMKRHGSRTSSRHSSTKSGRNGAAFPTSPLSDMSVARAGPGGPGAVPGPLERLPDTQRAPSSAFHTFSAELLVFGVSGAHGSNTPRQPWEQDSHSDHIDASQTRCTEHGSSVLASTVAGTDDQLYHRNRCALERTLHSTLGLIHAGLVDGADAVAGVESPCRCVPPSVTLQMASHNSDSQRRSMLSLTATAAQSQTWFGGSPLLYARDGLPAQLGLAGVNFIARACDGSAGVVDGAVPTSARAAEARRDAAGECRESNTMPSAISSATSTSHAHSNVTEMEARPNAAAAAAATPRDVVDTDLIASGTNIDNSYNATTQSLSDNMLVTPVVAPWHRPFSSGLTSPLLSVQSDLADWQHSRPFMSPLRISRMPSPGASVHADLMSYGSPDSPSREALLLSASGRRAMAAAAMWHSATSVENEDTFAMRSSESAKTVTGGGPASEQTRAGSRGDTPMSFSSVPSNSTQATSRTHRTVISAPHGGGQSGSAQQSGTSSLQFCSARASRHAREGTTTDGGGGITSHEMSLAGSVSLRGGVGRESTSAILGIDMDASSRGTPSPSEPQQQQQQPNRASSPRVYSRGGSPSSVAPSVRVGTPACALAAASETGDADRSTEGTAFIALVDVRGTTPEDNGAPLPPCDHPLLRLDPDGFAERSLPPSVLKHPQSGSHSTTPASKAPESWRPRERGEAVANAAGSLSPRSSCGRAMGSVGSSWTSVDRPRSVVIIDETQARRRSSKRAGNGLGTVAAISGGGGETGFAVDGHDFPLFSLSTASNASQASNGVAFVSVAQAVNSSSAP